MASEVVKDTAGGALLGAGVGSVVPVIGTGLGAIIGGGIGLVGGLLSGSDAPP